MVEHEGNIEIRTEEVNHERRSFMKGAAAVGLTGIAGAAMAQQAAKPAVVARDETPGRGNPNARKPSLDMRNPESLIGVGEACKIVMNHFLGINRRDIKAVADTLHFPFGIFEGVEPVKVDTEADLIAHAPASLNMTTNPERFTDHDGYIEPGAYDVFDGLEVYNSDPVQVSVAMSYDRYSPSGAKLLRCDGIYCVTNNDGRWAIQAASTIWTPGDQVGIYFPDSVQEAYRLRQRHTQGYQLMYLPDVWANIRQLGPNMSVGGARNNDYGYTEAPPFKNGVKSRLSISNTTQEQLDAIKIDFSAARNRWKDLKMGNWGFDYGGSKPARVIHQSVNKVHMYQGTTRYTAGGEFISNTMEMDVITLVKDRWGIAGILGNMLVRDRSNDIANIKL